MRIRNLSFTAVLSLLACALTARELMIKEMSLPQFDEAGRMTRRLTSDAVSGTFEEPHLARGTVEFFRTKGGAPEKVATLEFSDAVCQRALGIISGKGRVHLKSPAGEVSGEGYVFEMATGRLRLTSKVVIDFPLAHVEGAEGEVFFVQAAPDEEYAISQATLSGGVVASGFKSPAYPFERAETSTATYSAGDGALRLATPVTGWSKGQKSVVDAKEILFLVGKPSARKDVPKEKPYVPPAK